MNISWHLRRNGLSRSPCQRDPGATLIHFRISQPAGIDYFSVNHEQASSCVLKSVLYSRLRASACGRVCGEHSNLPDFQISSDHGAGTGANQLGFYAYHTGTQDDTGTDVIQANRSLGGYLASQWHRPSGHPSSKVTSWRCLLSLSSNRLCHRTAAVSLSSGLMPVVLWTISKLNVSDHPVQVADMSQAPAPTPFWLLWRRSSSCESFD